MAQSLSRIDADHVLLEKWSPEKLSTLEPLSQGGFFVTGLLQDSDHAEKHFFQHRELDADHWAFLVVELEGQGLTAALFRAQLAGLFHAHFVKWRLLPTVERFDLTAVVRRMNDLVHAMKLAGWASLKLGVLQHSTAQVTLCSPGWKMHQVFRQTGGLELVRGPSVPSVGTFPAEDFDPICRQSTLELAPGDGLLCLGATLAGDATPAEALTGRIQNYCAKADRVPPQTLPFALVWLLQRRS